MSQRRRAQFLLTTPLGAVEYDVLEDSVFIGPARRGGLTADPAPFPEALVAVTAGPEGFVIRALPGEAPPQINGQAADGHILAHGDKVQLGEHVAAFRAEARVVPATPTAARAASTKPIGVVAGPAPAEPMASSSAGPRRPRGRTRARTRANPWVTAVALSGALLLMVGLYLVLEHLAGLRADQRVSVYVPDPPEAPVRLTARSNPPAKAYDEAAGFELAHPDDPDGTLKQYRSVLRQYPQSPEADRARTRIRELVDEAGSTALAKLEEKTKALALEGRFRTALKAVRQFERRYGATSSGEAVEPIRRRVREEARKALDKLLTDIGPVVSADPRRAHRLLLSAGAEYPPDLAAEITDVMERAIALMKTQGRPPPERREPPPVEPRRPPPGEAAPRETDEGEEPDGDLPVEGEARQAWQGAWEALKAGKYQDALDAYTLMSLRYGGTDLYRENRSRITAGRSAAKAGAQGPAGLLSVPVEEKRGRLEVEYTFDDGRVLQRDFRVEQPFPSDRPVTFDMKEGALHMKDATGLFHVLVWSQDVRIEARVVAEVAHDIGIVAVAEADEFRAVMLNVNNTRFKLKKGANARPNPGHLLWFMGQGVWSDADADSIGFIKIAERPKVTIQNGDRLTLELIRRGDDCEGSFHGRTDGVSLRGAVKGDDGRGMGAARIGLFTDTGALVVESLKISGRVDEAWFKAHLAELVADAGGPPDTN